MYQMVIEDLGNNVRYMSSLVATESELKSQGVDSFMRAEHMLKYPNDAFMDDEMLEEVFRSVRVVGLVPIEVQSVEDL